MRRQRPRPTRPRRRPQAPTASDFSTPEFVGAPVVDGAVPKVAEPSDPPEERQKVLVGYGPRATSLKRRARKGAVASVDTEKVAQHKPLRALAKPPVRKLAKDLGIDLGAVPERRRHHHPRRRRGLRRPVRVDNRRACGTSSRRRPVTYAYRSRVCAR